MRGDHSVKMSYMQRDLSKSMTVDRTVSAMNNAMINMDINSPQGVAGAPNEKALLSLMEKTGFSMIQENGQRKYGGPPPGWDGPPPPRGCEIFVGKIPRDCYEDELVPIFTQIGKIYELRLMMDFSGSNRGYAFVMYINREDAKRAVKELNNFEIRKGRLLGVCKSVDNCRLFVGGIPKNKHREEILEEMSKVTEGVVDVIVYPSVTDKAKNRGFAFVEYESHRSAAMARRKLIPGRIQLWGHQIAVDWAEPETEVDEDVMLTVKILYIRNLMLSTSEERIAELCCKVLGKENVVERVKKMRDYAFVHFRDRDDATLAMDYLNGTNLEGSVIEVSYAKPVDKTDYLRITKNVGARALYTPGYGFQAYDASTFSSPTLYTTLPLAAARGFPMGMRTPIRGRGRLAAGSRGGAGRGYIPGMRMPYRHPADDARLFDLLPGMELTPTNPITLKPQNVKSPIQILDDFCQKNGWGSPMYQLNSTPGRDGTQLFVYKVTVPVLNTNPFCPNKLCRTPDDSKLYAAQYVLAQLGVPYEAPPGDYNRPAYAAAAAAYTPSGYSSHGAPVELYQQYQ